MSTHVCVPSWEVVRPGLSSAHSLRHLRRAPAVFLVDARLVYQFTCCRISRLSRACSFWRICSQVVAPHLSALLRATVVRASPHHRPRRRGRDTLPFTTILQSERDTFKASLTIRWPTKACPRGLRCSAQPSHRRLGPSPVQRTATIHRELRIQHPIRAREHPARRRTMYSRAAMVGRRTMIVQAASLRAVRPYNSFIMTRLTKHLGRRIGYTRAMIKSAHDHATSLLPTEPVLEPPSLPQPSQPRKRKRSDAGINARTGGARKRLARANESGPQLYVFPHSCSLA
jgi:hypothetical protein